MKAGEPKVGDRVRYENTSPHATWKHEPFTGTVTKVDVPGLFGDHDIRVRKDSGVEIGAFASELTLITEEDK